MKKTKCLNGHFFDADRFQNCPICGCKPQGVASERPTKKVSDELETTALPPQLSAEVQRIDAVTEKNEDRSVEARDKRFGEEDKAVQGEAEAPTGTVSESTSGVQSLWDAVKGTGSTNNSPLPKTVAFYGYDDVEPPVAWLVCVKGAYLGCAFECKTGRNKIGRGIGMDVNLEKDLKVTREVNAFLVYEPKKKSFFIQEGLGNGLVYHNDDVVMNFSPLKEYDHVSLGDSEFVFVPLCGEHFSWEDYITEGKIDK